MVLPSQIFRLEPYSPGKKSRTRSNQLPRSTNNTSDQKIRMLRLSQKARLHLYITLSGEPTKRKLQEMQHSNCSSQTEEIEIVEIETVETENEETLEIETEELETEEV